LTPGGSGFPRSDPPGTRESDFDRARNAAGGKGGAPAPENPSRAHGEDLALLGLALLLLVVPAWIEPSAGLQPLPGSAAAVPGGSGREAGGIRALSIDVNRAPWHAWALLNGIGETRARQIVAFREHHGPFRCVDDLDRVPGLPAGWLEEARPYLTVAADSP
jgi:competence protein ComEA